MNFFQRKKYKYALLRFNLNPLLLLFLLLPALSGCLISGCCWKYSFTSGKLDGKTISIDRFENEALVVVPSLSQDFTEALRDRFNSQTNLQLITTGGDHYLSGNVSDYNVVPLAATGNETTASSRLTLSVKVKYQNNLHPEQSWDASFSNFADFSSTSNLSDVEKSLLEDITNKLTQDIFNKVLSNW